jgi:serine phosphatase RsbU (regulator of sigma subunit)
MSGQPSRLSRRPRSDAPLLRTAAGRAIVAAVAVKLLISAVRLTGRALPAIVDAFDVAAGIAIACGAVFLLVKLALVARRRLLWRVRRKLILSYIFIGFVPAILLVAFFVLGALLLFFNFSSYLVQGEVRSLDAQARSLATSAALEIQQAGGRNVAAILARRQRVAQDEFPGASLAVVAAAARCSLGPPTASGQGRTPRSQGSAPAAGLDDVTPGAAGPWAHVEPPASLPPWIACGGFSGLLAYARGGVTEMFVRGVAFPDAAAPAYGVVVDLPNVTGRIAQDTGVAVRSVSTVYVAGASAAPIEGRAGAGTGRDPAEPGGPLSWVTFLDYHDWATGQPGTLLVATTLSVPDIYQRISAAQGVVGDRPFGQALLLVLLVVVGGLFFIIEVVALAAGSALARSITGSVHELFAGTERVRQRDFSYKIAITADDQLGELARSFNSMTSSIDDLMRENAEKKRLEEELRIAHEIQMSLLPQGPLTMPGLSATALCIPAREVGGDYYDFLPLDDHRVGILIADVSGKGTSAALYMAQLKGLVLSLSTIHPSPRTLLVAANRLIAQHLDARSFITMTYAVVDLQARTMTYARAGHTPLILVPGPASRSRRAHILAPPGMVVGLKLDDGEMFERLLEEETLPLEPGDLYIFFTDGISEAMNAADDCFGEVRLGRLLEEHANLPAEELRERILREVQAFVAGAPQHDDMTMILLRVEDLPPGVGPVLESSASAAMER